MKAATRIKKGMYGVTALMALALAGCASFDPSPDARSMSWQPPMTADCGEDVLVTVRFVRHRSLGELASAYENACATEGDSRCVLNAARMRENGQQAVAFSTTRRDGVGELHYVAPRDFNDWYRLALVGHEAMHLCGARHDIVAENKGTMTVFGYREYLKTSAAP
jgi:hypothetical protein